MTDYDADRLRAVHDHLLATEELPVEAAASVRLAEAEAVAADAVAADADGEPAVVRERLEQVETLLAGVDTGNDAADAHVADARTLVAELLDG